jgi:hypothetical protein
MGKTCIVRFRPRRDVNTSTDAVQARKAAKGFDDLEKNRAAANIERIPKAPTEDAPWSTSRRKMVRRHPRPAPMRSQQ